MATILGNVRILDLTRILAGPWCTQILGEMGAEVLKVENPEGGDETRGIPPFHQPLDGSRQDLSAFFVACNRGKKSVVVDIRQPEGQDALRRLVARSDVFVENFKVGNLARYGLDYESLRAVNPRLVYCSITGYGQSGPMAGYPGYDILFQGMSGAMSTCGLPDGEPGGGPMRTLVAYTDILTGMYACTAILGALHHVKATGEGQHIDVALLDVAVAANAHIAANYLLTGVSQQRIGNAGIAAAPSGVYRCKDGDVIIQSSSRQWKRLCTVLDKPHWVDDPRFDSVVARLQNIPALDALIREAVRDWHRADLVEALGRAAVPCSPVNTIGEALDEPQVRHREMVQSVSVDQHAGMRVLRNPIRYSKTPLHTAPPPRLGQHTDEVLTSAPAVAA